MLKSYTAIYGSIMFIVGKVKKGNLIKHIKLVSFGFFQSF